MLAFNPPPLEVRLASGIVVGSSNMTDQREERPQVGPKGERQRIKEVTRPSGRLPAFRPSGGNDKPRPGRNKDSRRDAVRHITPYVPAAWHANNPYRKPQVQA